MLSLLRPQLVTVGSKRQGIKLVDPKGICDEVLTWKDSKLKTLWYAHGDLQFSLLDAVEITYPKLTEAQISWIVAECKLLKLQYDKTNTLKREESTFTLTK